MEADTLKEKKQIFDEQYKKVDRAETRLSRNLSNSFWAFANYTSFHLGFMYIVVEKMSPFGVPNRIIALITIIGGIILHIASIKSNNTYRTKLRANEEVIDMLEVTVDDLQQKHETKAKKPRLFGAGEARVMIFYSLLCSEFAIAYMFWFVK